MDPLARRGRTGSGRGGTTHGHGAGPLRLHSLTSLRSSSTRPSSPSHAPRSTLHQQTLYRAPWRLPMLTHVPPRVAITEERRGLKTRLRASVLYVPLLTQ